METTSLFIAHPSFIINLIDRDDEKTRNKGWRRFQQDRVFKARMVKFSCCGYVIIDEAGRRIGNPHWFEIARQRWAKKNKDSSTPCSCWLCRGEKYSRLQAKKETERILSESLG